MACSQPCSVACWRPHGRGELTGKADLVLVSSMSGRRRGSSEMSVYAPTVGSALEPMVDLLVFGYGFGGLVAEVAGEARCTERVADGGDERPHRFPRLTTVCNGRLELPLGDTKASRWRYPGDLRWLPRRSRPREIAGWRAGWSVGA